MMLVDWLVRRTSPAAGKMRFFHVGLRLNGRSGIISGPSKQRKPLLNVEHLEQWTGWFENPPLLLVGLEITQNRTHLALQLK
ncbi:hypothetical protein A7J67_04495 [Achromobacter xylosoxidans]|nr:hypothetical protein A7J67_04495 [Achromobacter xylosoxidans]